MNLSIDVLAMTDPEHSYCGARIIDIVEDSVNSRANPPVSFGVFQLFASRWPGVFRKRQHLLLDLFIRRGRMAWWSFWATGKMSTCTSLAVSAVFGQSLLEGDWSFT